MTPASATIPARRRCFSFSRPNRFASQTLLVANGFAHFGIRQSSIANRAHAVALQHGSFDSSIAELLISMLANRGTLRKFLDRVFTHCHSPNTPTIERLTERIRQLRIRHMLLFQKRFHQVGRLPRAAQNCETLPRLHSRSAIG